jgi:undecaprenyl-diphosphatase
MVDLILVFIARWLIFVLVFLISLISFVKWGRFASVFKVLTAVLVVDIIAEVLKYVFNVARPAVSSPLIVFDPAFPSAHTAVVAALGAIVFRRHKWLGFLLFILALLIGWSRVVLGAHYPVDIVGGFILGVLLGTCFAKCLKV